MTPERRPSSQFRHPNGFSIAASVRVTVGSRGGRDASSGPCAAPPRVACRDVLVRASTHIGIDSLFASLASVPAGAAEYRGRRTLCSRRRTRGCGGRRLQTAIDVLQRHRDIRQEHDVRAGAPREQANELDPSALHHSRRLPLCPAFRRAVRRRVAVLARRPGFSLRLRRLTLLAAAGLSAASIRDGLRHGASRCQRRGCAPSAARHVQGGPPALVTGEPIPMATATIRRVVVPRNVVHPCALRESRDSPKHRPTKGRADERSR